MRPRLSQYPFVPARHFTRAVRAGADLVVVHTMEAPEKPGTARGVANWFASESAPLASAHFCVGADEVIQCVELTSIAWAAPGANASGIHVEHEGYARQSPAEWTDERSRETLDRSALLVARLCREADIPVRRVTVPELDAGGARGICGHVDVSAAFRRSNHYDPGPHFPWDSYLERISLQLTAADTEPSPPPIETPLPVLARGATGEAVALLQRTLGRAGFPLAVDGIFGAQTDAAVRGFQAAPRIAVTGVVDASTWDSLRYWIEK